MAQSDIAAAFKRSGFSVLNESVEGKLSQILSGLNKSAQWGAQHYEVFLSSREYAREVTPENAEAFEEYARQESRKEGRKRISFADQNVAPDNLNKQVPHSAKKLKTPATDTPTPLKSSLKSSTSTPIPLKTLSLQTENGAKSQKDSVLSSSRARNPIESPASQFHARTEKQKVISGYNRELAIPPFKKVRSPSEEIAIRTIGEAMNASQNYMVDTLPDKVNYIEGRILNFAKRIEASKGITFDHAVNAPTQEDVWTVGRICNDSDARLAQDNLMLEGSILHSQGMRVHLDLSRLESFSVNPGEIIAVRGVNASGNCFTAKQIITSVDLPQHKVHEGREPLSMVIAAGPFSLPTNVQCEPLEELIEYCREKKAQVLVLCGPFVDAQNPKIQEGQEDQLHQDIFEEWVIQRLISLTENTSIILLPSIRDVHHSPVFPQPALHVTATENIFFMDNPSRFSCQNSSFGAISSDVLMALSSTELRKGMMPGRLAQLAAKIVHQNSFFPVYPPPIEAFLDTTLSKFLELSSVPDILIVPSDLNSFAKMLPLSDSSQCLCINPGRLIKGHSAGNFAHLQIQGNEIRQPIDKACKVEIIQI